MCGEGLIKIFKYGEDYNRINISCVSDFYDIDLKEIEYIFYDRQLSKVVLEALNEISTVIWSDIWHKLDKRREYKEKKANYTVDYNYTIGINQFDDKYEYNYFEENSISDHEYSLNVFFKHIP
jgi:hypothetical protein